MKKVLLLLANGFEILEASAFVDVIGLNLEEGNHSTKLYTCGLNKKITSSFDQRFSVNYQIDNIVDISEFDALAIPGGFEQYGFYLDAYDTKFLNLIRQFNSENKMIATICVGALPVAKSGILKHRKATTYNNKNRRNTLKECGVICVDKAVVIDDVVITSSSPSTAIDVAFHLLEHLTSRENSNKVRRLMGFNNHILNKSK